MSNVGGDAAPSAQSSFQKSNVDNSCQKTHKIRYYIFEVILKSILLNFFSLFFSLVSLVYFG